jgi:hypothetical protein
MTLDTFLLEWGMPVFALGFGIIALVWALLASRRFDHKYGKGPYGSGPYGR